MSEHNNYFKILNSKYFLIGFSLLFFLVFLPIVFNFHEIIDLRPQSTHQSRQINALSYTLNYYQDDLPFLETKFHSLSGKEGRAASEFPLFYFISAKIYEITGPDESILRIIHLLIFYFALLAAFGIGVILLKSYWLALVLPLFLFTTPILVYYGFNYLPNMPAFSFEIIGWFFFFLFLKSRKSIYLIILFSVLTLATLIKMTSGISLIAIISILSLIKLFNPAGIENISKRETIIGIFLSIGSILVIYLWVDYVKHYNLESGSGYNLIGIWPIWEMTSREILSTIKIYFSKWLYHFFYLTTIALLILAIIILIIKRNRIPFVLKWSLLLVAIGVFAMIILFFHPLYHHDYYLINALLLPFLILIGFLYVIKPWIIRHLTLFIVISIIFFGINIVHVRNMQKERYEGKLFETINPAIYNGEEFLRSLGISRDEKIVVVPDQSPNTTLYFFNNPGWTEAFTNKEYNLYYFVDLGADYLIVHDSTYLEQDFYKPFTNEFVGKQDGIFVYKIDYMR